MCVGGGSVSDERIYQRVPKRNKRRRGMKKREIDMEKH